MRISAIIPAAGLGKRLQRAVRGTACRAPTLPPKAFLPLGGQTVLARTISRLLPVPEIREIVVAVHPKYRRWAEKLALPHAPRKRIQFVAGGDTRTESVSNALKRVSPRATHVLIHDGVRPFVTTKTVRQLIRAAGKSRALILAHPMVPTVKEVRGGQVRRTVDRTHLWEVQTPQLYEKSLLKKAFRKFLEAPFRATDDAMLVERLGEPVKVFRSEDANLKITSMNDWEIARKLVSDSPEMRMGWGEDRHRLIRGRPLILGGVKIPSSWGSVGHSDGDAILHALIDAMLGALGEGDIGELFPDKDPRWRGAASTRLLRTVLQKVKKRGFRVNNADVTVILEHPRLSVWKKKIQRNIARELAIPPECVGVKAKTSEGLGPEGRGEAVLAHALVTLKQFP